MAESVHIEQIRQGISNWNKWRVNNRDIHPDLGGVNLSNAKLTRAYLYFTKLAGAKLVGADLSNAYLNESDLSDARLAAADLSGARLVGARLVGANLVAADLSGADLRRADLSGADLSNAALGGANLSDTNLSDTNLSGASLKQTIFARCNLQTIKGLATIRHYGRSTIELFSVQLPQDGSALHFLRGVGVPDEWIDFYRASAMHPIQYYSCFISYTNRDEMLAKRLHADLQAEGVRCWFAPEDMKIGDKIRERVNEAIHLQDKLLLLLSEHALTSDWIETEVEVALAKERKEQREVLFPVRLDEIIMRATQAWIEHLRLKRHIGDFTKWWKPEAYQSAFERLLRDLKQK